MSLAGEELQALHEVERRPGEGAVVPAAAPRIDRIEVHVEETSLLGEALRIDEAVVAGTASPTLAAGVLPVGVEFESLALEAAVDLVERAERAAVE